jgi:hypothetical protein
MMFRRGWKRRGHTPGVLAQCLEVLRGREQMLIRGLEQQPLLLVSFPPGRQEAAEKLRFAYRDLLPSLAASTQAMYAGLFERLPAMVVVLLRGRGVCDCLGHQHPKGTESALTRRLQNDLGGPVGEIDLACDQILQWQPWPISDLASGVEPGEIKRLHFPIALLSVLLHELEHLAFPLREEAAIRLHSNRFYVAAMDELVNQEFGARYGMGSGSLRP